MKLTSCKIKTRQGLTILSVALLLAAQNSFAFQTAERLTLSDGGGNSPWLVLKNGDDQELIPSALSFDRCPVSFCY